MLFGINNIYPNPFNPTTTLNFNLDKSEMISINVYDLYGNKLETLINNKLLNAGNHNLIWDASHLSSGIYFINISNGLSSSNKKIILQK